MIWNQLGYYVLAYKKVSRFVYTKTQHTRNLSLAWKKRLAAFAGRMDVAKRTIILRTACGSVDKGINKKYDQLSHTLDLEASAYHRGTVRGGKL